MRLIILAAGRGERLMPLTRNTPKPLLDLGNGNTLLEEQMASAAASGVIDEIVVVTGYLAEQVEAKIAYHRRHNSVIRTIYNPFYAVSNNLMSLWLARNELDRDCLITNGDNLFTPDVFSGLAHENADGIFLALGRKQQFDYDDMRVSLDGEFVRRVSKGIADNEADAESPGLTLIRGRRSRGLVRDNLELLARDPAALGHFWLELFNALYDSGVPVRPWWFDTRGKWHEVDVHIDIRAVQESLARSLSATTNEVVYR